jgi:WD40 repeat protein
MRRNYSILFFVITFFFKAQSQGAGHTDFIVSARFLADGKTLITESFDSTIRIWDAMTGKELARIPIDIKLRIMHAEFSPDQSRIFTFPLKGKPALWNASTGTQTALLSKPPKTILSGAFSFDNKKLVVVDEYQKAYLYDANTGRKMKSPKEAKFSPNFARFSPDGKILYTLTYDAEDHLYYYTFWSAKKGGHLGAFTINFSRSSDFPDSLPFSKDGKRVLVYFNSAATVIRDPYSGKEKGRLDGYSYAVKTASFYCNDAYIITTTDDNACQVWSNNANGNKMLYTVKGITFNSFHISSSVHVAADQKTLVTIHDKSLQSRNVETSALLNEFKGHTGKITSFEFSPSDSAGAQRVITASDDRTAKVWDLKTGKLLFSLEGHENVLREAHFSPDGRLIVTITGNVIRTWDARTGRLIARM